MHEDFKKLAPLLRRFVQPARPRVEDLEEIAPGIYRRKLPPTPPRIVQELDGLKQMADRIKKGFYGL
jgi:hypothetical protein